MIVVSDSLVLAPGDAFGANSPVIGWRNIVTAGNVTAEEALAGYPASNLANPITSLGASWQGETAAEQHATVLTGSADDIDYLAVARHNFGSEGIAVSIEGRDSAMGSFTTLAGPQIPADDAPILFRFEPQPLYEIRLKMTAGGAPPRAAVMYAGLLLVVPRAVWANHTPIVDGIVAESAAGVSEAGNFLGRIVTGESRRNGLALTNIDADWYRANLRPFVGQVLAAPFFFAWRPARYPAETGYVWVTEQPVPVNRIGGFGLMDIQFALGGIA